VTRPAARNHVVALVLAALIGASATLAAQTDPSGSSSRVFLKTGEALPTYGSYALVDDRVVFNLIIGNSTGSALLQLMSLPVGSVDLPRTVKYAEAMRAAYYLASRAESDYRGMTTTIAEALSDVRKETDPKRRLQLAEDARRQLLAWPATHYNYRADDIHQTASLFDDVIAELRAAAGESAFSLDLTAGTAAPTLEPLLPAPSLRDSIALALAAAKASDTLDERLAILRTAGVVAGIDASAADLTSEIGRRLADEARIDAAYAALASDLRARAEAAVKRGEVAKAAALAEELARRDRELGAARPDLIRGLQQELTDKLEAARVSRLRLDHYAAVYPRMLHYEHQIRPALTALDGLKPVLTFIRDMQGMSFERLISARDRIDRLLVAYNALTPPEELADVHATIGSTLHMAREACARRRSAVISNDMALAREASAAAAGALLLADQARTELLARLFPSKQQ